MAIPEWPPRLRGVLMGLGLGELYNWWQAFSSYFNQRIDTSGDITLKTASKGIVMTNAAGTVTKRVKLNSAGDGLLFEDVT